MQKIGMKVTVVDKEIGYELRCAPPISYDIDYTRSLGYEAVQFLLGGGTGAMIALQENEAVPLYFEDLKDPKTGKTRVRRVQINSINYKIARGFMLRLEKEDLEDPGIANAYKMNVTDFKKRYQYLFN
jgi:6-phosphofructokinase 1